MKNNHFNDEQGRPAGGISTGIGFTIAWQNGPCPFAADGSQPDRNGAFLIEVLESCQSRLHAYQDSNFACEENAQALRNLNDAIRLLKSRRDRRSGC